MKINYPKLTIGFILYGESTAKYLPYFLDSLKRQTIKDFKVFAVDNSGVRDNENDRYIKKNYPEIRVEWTGKNLGFAGAHNRMIKKAVKAGAQYYLSLNTDMILEPEAVAKMVKAMDEDSKLDSASPKILKWDFESSESPAGDSDEAGSGASFKDREDPGKTNIIDTCGIVLKRGLRFEDLGQGEKDDGRFDNVGILGHSGAAAIYRISALEKIKKDIPPLLRGGRGILNEYFDELMFMYKEDCDLAYRFFISGLKSKFISDAVVYHDRTVGAKGGNSLQIALNRKNKSRQAKKWAFLNQHIIFIKYWELQDWKNKIFVIWYALKMFIFVVLFEQYLFGQYIKLWKIRKRIKRY